MPNPSKPYREFEHKYLLRGNEVARVPDQLLMAPARPIEQYYLNHHTDPYELRVRRVQLDDQAVHFATIKKGTPPDRLEMETPISSDTYDFWIADRTTEPVRKTRQTLEFAAGHWALDSFMDIDLCLLEAEGDVPQPDFGRNVTSDIRFTNYQIAQINDVAAGYLPNTLTPAVEKSDLSRLRAQLEIIRQQRDGPITLGVSGDSGSGKTTLTRDLLKPYGHRAVLLSQDHYYKGVTKMREQFGPDYEVNFDAPIAIDLQLLAHHLSELRAGRPIQRPTYDMATSDPTGEYVTIDPSITPIIGVEGIHTLDPVLQEQYDHTIFVETTMATRVGRRLERDLQEGRSYKPEDNLRYLLETAEPTYRPYAKAQKAVAGTVFTT